MNTDNTNTQTAGNESTNSNPATETKKASSKKTAKPVKPAAKKPAVKTSKPAKKTAKPAKKAAKPVKVKKAAKPVAKKPSKKPSKKAARTADNFDRNFGRVRFNGESFSKGRAVHAVVLAFVEKKKPTAAQLQTAFPAELLKNYGIVKEAAKARQYNVNGKTRYFVASEDLIKTKDGKSFAVCNQFSTENIKPFIKHAKSLGFTMTAGK